MGFVLEKIKRLGLVTVKICKRSPSLMVEQALENSARVKEDEYEDICAATKTVFLRIMTRLERTSPAEKKIELCLDLEKRLRGKIVLLKRLLIMVIVKESLPAILPIPEKFSFEKPFFFCYTCPY